MPNTQGNSNALPKPKASSEKYVQDDPRRSPSGIYSGMTKRLAISDDSFVDIQNLPKGPPSYSEGRRPRSER